jgi:hypothetical protein
MQYCNEFEGLTIPRSEFISFVKETGVQCERTCECASGPKKQPQYHNSGIISSFRHATKHGTEEDNWKSERSAWNKPADGKICRQQQQNVADD